MAIPRLIADIGGTNARFALSGGGDDFSRVEILPCADHAGLEEAVREYLFRNAGTGIRDAVIAIATPVLGDRVSMTNHHWSFSIEATRQALGLRTLRVINDFSALAMSLPFLRDDQVVRFDLQGEVRQGVKAVVGPGTGLGVAGLVPVGGGWQALATEGGHVEFAPADPLEIEVLKILWREFSHVSVERLVSGPGIVLLYRALCEIHGVPPAVSEAARIVELATADACPVARQTLVTFSGLLGAVAGNVALTFGALGGVYLGGGVLGKLGQGFDVAAYRERFVAKGRFRAYLEAIPNYLITAEQPAFIGAARDLEQWLTRPS